MTANKLPMPGSQSGRTGGLEGKEDPTLSLVIDRFIAESNATSLCHLLEI